MLSDAEARCVAIALTLCLKGKSIAAALQSGTEDEHNIHTKISWET
jgi:hypothetical protein